MLVRLFRKARLMYGMWILQVIQLTFSPNLWFPQSLGVMSRDLVFFPCLARKGKGKCYI